MTGRHKENLEILTMLAARWPRAFVVHEAKRRPLKVIPPCNSAARTVIVSPRTLV
jgi:hypothetical protein